MVDAFIEDKNRQSSSQIIRSKNNNKNRQEMGLLSLLKNDLKGEFLAKQLTLSQTGWQIIPTTVL